MKKIIHNRVYDTETARHLGTYTSDYGVTDFQYFEESLYRKRTGEFFLYGEGGPLSPYSRPYEGSGSQGGWKITPLTFDQAREWAENKLDADEYLSIFEPDPEDDTEVNYSFSLPGEYAAIVDRLRSGGKTIQEVFMELLDGARE